MWKRKNSNVFVFCYFVGPFVFFRPAGREGALRQFDRRKVSNPPAAPSTAAARQRGPLLFIAIRRREKGIAALLCPAQERSSRTGDGPSIAGGQSSAHCLPSGQNHAYLQSREALFGKQHAFEICLFSMLMAMSLIQLFFFF